MKDETVPVPLQPLHFERWWRITCTGIIAFRSSWICGVETVLRVQGFFDYFVWNCSIDIMGGLFLFQVRWMQPLLKGRPSGGPVTKTLKKPPCPLCLWEAWTGDPSYNLWFQSFGVNSIGPYLCMQSRFVVFFNLFFRYFIHDQVLFNFFPDSFFQTGNSPDILNRIDTVNQDLPVRDNIEIS